MESEAVITHLNGEPRLQCDGCFKVIEENEYITRMMTGATVHFHVHFHNAKCESLYTPPSVPKQAA
jgi:hypothetical protein